MELFHFSWSENLAHSSPSNHMWFLGCFSQRALHDVHSPCSHRSVVRWGGHMGCSCVYCLCLAGRVSFSTRAPVQSLTTANHKRTLTRILSPSSMWRTPATESQYSFYRMGWVNPESERTTEIKFPSWVGFVPTTSWSTVQRVTTELSPLHQLWLITTTCRKMSSRNDLLTTTLDKITSKNDNRRLLLNKMMYSNDN